MKYRITVSGCDDETTVDLDMTGAEVAFAEKLAEAVTEASEYSCQPKMRVAPTPEEAA
jgi:hypothetical protein